MGSKVFLDGKEVTDSTPGGVTSSYVADTYTTSSYVADTYMLSGEVPGGGVTSSYVADTYTTSSYTTKYAVSSDVADTYAASGDVADVYTTSSYVTDTYTTSGTCSLSSHVHASYAVSSDVADTYTTSGYVADNYLISGFVALGDVDHAVVRVDLEGDTLQGTLVTIDDNGGIDIPSGQSYNIDGSPHTHAGGDLTSSYVAETYVTSGTAATPTRSIVLTAAGGWPSVTTGCAETVIYTTTSGPATFYTLDFDGAVKEYAEWTVTMPDNYNGGTITAKFYWITAQTTSNGVTWGIQGIALGDTDTPNVVFGTAQTVVDYGTSTAYVLHISDATSTVTLAGTPAGGELVLIRVYRDPADGSDTMTSDARLVSVKIEYGTNAYSD